MKVKLLAKTATLASIAVIAGIIESYFPPILAFAPGVRLGLSNVVVLFALITCGLPSATAVTVVKVILVALFSGNPTAIMYSAPASLASLVVSYVLIRFTLTKISVITVSCISAITHNCVQLIVASLIASANLFAVVPLTLIASLIAGYGVGVIVYIAIKKLPEKIIG